MISAYKSRKTDVRQMSNLNIITIWSLFKKGADIYFRYNLSPLGIKIESTIFSRPCTWRFYSKDQSPILCILTHDVRFEEMPKFVIKDADIINSLLRENMIKVNVK